MFGLLKESLKALLRVEHKLDILIRLQKQQNLPHMNHNLTDPVTGRRITWEKIPTTDGRFVVVRSNDGYDPPR